MQNPNGGSTGTSIALCYALALGLIWLVLGLIFGWIFNQAYFREFTPTMDDFVKLVAGWGTRRPFWGITPLTERVLQAFLATLLPASLLAVTLSLVFRLERKVEGALFLFCLLMPAGFIAGATLWRYFMQHGSFTGIEVTNLLDSRGVTVIWWDDLESIWVNRPFLLITALIGVLAGVWRLVALGQASRGSHLKT